MLQQFLKVILCAQSLARILFQALCDEILTILTDWIVLCEEFQRRELDLFLFDHFDKFLVTQITGKERNIAKEHFKEEDAECPPVQSKRVALLLNHLRRHVLLRTANRL